VCPAASEKLGLFVPASLHHRMLAACLGKPRGALQADYAAAFADLLDALDRGEAILFAAVRGPKHRVTVRLTKALSLRLRLAALQLNLKITDLACAAITRRHPPQKDSADGQSPRPSRPW
jgi:hypothetical protein